MTESFLSDIFEDSGIITGYSKVPEPELCPFNLTAKALRLLHKHVENKSTIVVHGDVDMDGIGSTFLMMTMLRELGALAQSGFIINKEKSHGITNKHSEYFRKNRVGLLIVLDSSCNELDVIRDMECDVLVIDHHEVMCDIDKAESELCGTTVNGNYVIVTNMVPNFNSSQLDDLSIIAGKNMKAYNVDSRMSACLVLYEFLRWYEIYYGIGDFLKVNKLEQWVGITLFTDAVQLSTLRNQYYMTETVLASELEPTLKRIAETIRPYRPYLDKSFINFSFAPKINKAIRAGASAEALDIVLNRPYDILQLDKYKEIQDNILEGCTEDVLVGMNDGDTYTLKDITDKGISKSYCGVIASRLVDATKHNTAVCMVNKSTGLLEGSFRGRMGGVDYRGYACQLFPGIYAQGHKQAFGFKMSSEQLNTFLGELSTIEPVENKGFYLTAGEMPDRFKGKHHIDDMDEFKRACLMLQLSLANCKLSTEEAIDIAVLNTRNFEHTVKGKLHIYNILGVECKAFKELTSAWVGIYVEYTKNIDIYVRDIKL